MEGDEIRALRKKWLKERPKTALDLVFASERGPPPIRQSACRIVAEAGRKAELELDIHPRMLKHSCGYYLATRGYDTRLIQDYWAINKSRTQSVLAYKPEENDADLWGNTANGVITV